MRDVLSDIDRWLERGEPIALATVIQTWGSAPRRVGAKMAMTSTGEIAGSVSGGCVEGAVFETGSEVLKTGRPQLLHFGVTDDTAWEVGLACGGTIEVFVEKLDLAHYDTLRAALIEEQPAATVTVVRGPEEYLGRTLTLLANGGMAETVRSDLDLLAASTGREALASGESKRLTLTAPDAVPLEVFVEVLLPSPTLVIVGGVHIAIALASLAKTLGYRTILVDPRKAFGSEARFPNVDHLIQAWPEEALAQVNLNRSTAVATLTHDPKLDDPALRVALHSPAFYVGALGSIRTQAQRRERLADAGLTEAQLDRLHGPIGLDIGASTPEEIALAVMAQIIAVRNKQI